MLLDIDAIVDRKLAPLLSRIDRLDKAVQDLQIPVGRRDLVSDSSTVAGMSENFEDIMTKTGSAEDAETAELSRPVSPDCTESIY